MSNAIQILNEISGNQEDRIQAIFSLLHNTSEDAFGALIYSIRNDPSPIVRHEAAYVLGEKGSSKAIEELIRCIKYDENDFVVHEAALALGNTKSPKALSVLTELLSHPMEDVRQTAQIAIERLDPQMISDPEQVILDLNQRPEDRIQASFRLMNEGSLDSIRILLKAMHAETNPIVKHEIIFALGELASDLIVPELCNVINAGGNRFVLHEASLALATIGNVEAEDTIRSLLHHPDPDVAETAEIALIRLCSS